MLSKIRRLAGKSSLFNMSCDIHRFLNAYPEHARASTKELRALGYDAALALENAMTEEEVRAALERKIWATSASAQVVMRAVIEIVIAVKRNDHARAMMHEAKLASEFIAATGEALRLD